MDMREGIWYAHLLNHKAALGQLFAWTHTGITRALSFLLNMRGTSGN